MTTAQLFISPSQELSKLIITGKPEFAKLIITGEEGLLSLVAWVHNQWKEERDLELQFRGKDGEDCAMLIFERDKK